MIRYATVLFCAALISFNVELIQARRYGGIRGGGGSHSYPRGPGLPSHTHSYPKPNNRSLTDNQSTKNVHHYYNYIYNPPKQINYASPDGGPAKSYPVYRGTPPIYVYLYKDSGSKYGTLLAGLALLNLGVLAGGAGGCATSSQQGYWHSYNYKTQPNEVCLFGVKKDNGDYEEARIECQLISSFIIAEQAKQQTLQYPSVTTMTVVNTTNAQDGPVYVMSTNGTLVPLASVPLNAGNATSEAPATDRTVTSSVITTTNTTTVNAVNVKGPAIQVTPGMQCYVMRRTPSSIMKKRIICGLLQTYAEKSLKNISVAINVSFPILDVISGFVNTYYIKPT